MVIGGTSKEMQGMKDFLVWATVRVAFGAMIVLVFAVFVGVYGSLANVQEDDATFNCWVMGNGHCGPAAPWHGFVNGFKHADDR